MILSAGSIDTPKILQLSGVGPAEELKKHAIPVVVDLPGVGANLYDHSLVRMRLLLKQGTICLPMPEAQNAREQWLKNRTGPFGTDDGLVAIGYFKVKSATNSTEFQLLNKEKRAFVSQDSVPNYEMGIVSLFIHQLKRDIH